MNRGHPSLAGFRILAGPAAALALIGSTSAAARAQRCMITERDGTHIALMIGGSAKQVIKFGMNFDQVIGVSAHECSLGARLKPIASYMAEMNITFGSCPQYK